MGIEKFGLEIYNKLLFVSLNVNGKPGYFLVDSGANISALDINQKDDYHFSHNDNDSPVTGISGKWTTYEATSVTVDYQGAVLDINFTINDLNHVREALSKHVNLLGVIGGDFLSLNELIINYKDKTMYQTK
jgi:hypothetical protein